MLLNFFKPKRVFLDYAGSTPVDSSVAKEIQRLQNKFANPSGLYKESVEAKELLENFRVRVAKVLNVTKNEIIFTSGATEANNLALLGVFEANKKDNFVPHFITSSIEHSSTLEVCKEIEKRGGEVTVLPVSVDGLVSADSIKNVLKSNTVMLSLALANSEIGTIQPISEIGKIVKDWNSNNSNKIIFHVDGSGASIYQSFDIARMGVHVFSLDGSKIYGPKGVGCVFIKSGTNIKPIIFGGGQERGLRSGTENISSIGGFTLALEMADRNRDTESERLKLIRDYAIEQILGTFKNVTLNGSIKHRLPNNVNVCFKGLDAEFATIQLDILGFAVSYSSSCLTLKDDLSSYVIRALGKTEDCSKSSLRFTFGRDTKKGDIDKLIVALKKVVK
ncbi:MAG TPA: cysteine desulfurase family protein [Parcubacteria group bacterium]|jgi:cysteine desulfurase|nr:cysteine desulfurase family protein [Parcubacteria group bacterium]